jgi:hypothetical protein
METERNYEVRITVTTEAGGITNLEIPLDVAATASNDLGQDTANAATVSPATDLTLAQQGATAARQAAGAVMTDVISKLKNDLSKVNTDNPSTTNSTTNQTPTTEVVKPDMVEPQPIEQPSESASAFNTSETHSIATFEGNNKPFTWLPQTGAYYGGPVLFSFPTCGELYVPDASLTHGKDGNSKNYNQAFYFCGTDFPVGTSENNNSRASIFAPPGCKDRTVTLYYNK